jgi:hypothetical protein
MGRLAKFKRLSGPMALKIERTPRCTRGVLEFLDRALVPPPVLMAFKLVFFVQLARMATRSPVHPLQGVRAFQGWTGTTPQAVRSASTKAQH